MHKRGLCRCAVSVCLGVCLSRSCIESKQVNVGLLCYQKTQTSEDSSFYFCLPNVMAIFRREALTGPSNAGGIWKKWWLTLTNIPLYLENRHDSAIVTTEHQKSSWLSFWKFLKVNQHWPTTSPIVLLSAYDNSADSDYVLDPLTQKCTGVQS